MDHFALPDDDLARAQERGSLHRNFMGYTTHADCDLVGLGVSAISHIGDSFSQNPRDLPGWQSAIDEGRLPVCRGMRIWSSTTISCARDLIQQLMCQGRDRRCAALEAPLRDRFRLVLRRCAGAAAAAGRPMDWSRSTARSIAATARGRLLLRNIAMCFDRYLDAARAPEARPQFSRVI